MDIGSLLSPSDTSRFPSLTPSNIPIPASQAPTTTPSPRGLAQRSLSGGSSRAVTGPAISSPLIREIIPPSSIPAHVRSPAQNSAQSSPLISPVPAGTTATPYHPRTSSTHNMDTLADLAAMQNHQPIRSTPPGAGSYGSSDSSSRLANTSAHRGSIDINMVETPKQLLRGDYTGTSLSLQSQQRMAELVGHIQETPSAYEAQIEVIKILHQGFVDHIYPSSDPSARRDPESYDLLQELRQARRTADKLFAVGEELWLDWLQDESILARSAEDRVMVIENCRKAVEEEFGSVRLWTTYGDWVIHCYEWAQYGGTDALADPEKVIGQDLFTWESVLEAWKQAVEATKHDMAQSHVIWNKSLKLQYPSYLDHMTTEAAIQVRQMFQARLRQPHARWEDTSQQFSSFVSANYSKDYEHLMAETLNDSAAAKAVWQARQDFESAVAQALETGDKYTEYQTYVSYIEWEKSEEDRIKRLKNKQKRREPITEPSIIVSMVNALYQRVELRVPSVPSVWDDHAAYLTDHRAASLPSLLFRATKHCPWSGSLWKQRLLASEIADNPFSETESIKHDATKTGMVDAAGLEEILKVHDAWCGYLVRRARRPDATEEDVDVAEMGIRTSIEEVQSLASKLDLESNIDTSFRLQRKYIEYLKSQGRLDNAHAQFDEATANYGHSWRFWLRFYEFEMQKNTHISSLQQNARDGGPLHSSAPFAVAILKRGLQTPGLDYPESLIEALVNHCEDYEDAEELQSALNLVSKVQKTLTLRRQQEAEQVAEKAAATPAEVIVEHRAENVAQNLHIGKRKREDEGEEETDTQKRMKADEALEGSTEAQISTQDPPKRDREHASILVQHVADGVAEAKIRQFFSKCGTLKSMHSLDDDERSWIVEFAEAEDAQFALSKDGQELEGSTISVVLNTGSTLYITNYPAAADESFLRDIFRGYGDITSIRFPSLQANKKRRFCYLEFKTPDSAHAALEANGQKLGDLELLVKISNPAVKKARAAPEPTQNDGRTIFVGQLPFRSKEAQIEECFMKYGDIDHLKVPRDDTVKSRIKGIAFITYVEASSAEKALEMNGRDFHGRKIRVNAVDAVQQSRHKSVASSIGRSMSPGTQVEGRAVSPAKIVAPVESAPLTTEQREERQQRTVFLTDVPDTVNEARIRALASRFGTVKKVLLKTNHAGALVEFESVADAGKAAIGMDGFEISEGRKVSVVDEAQMLEGKPEKQEQALPKKLNKSVGLAPPQVKRPGQSGPRRGGFLGKKTTTLGTTSAVHGDKPMDGKSQDDAKKSNEDFRAMLTGEKQ